MKELLTEIRKCKICEAYLPYEPKPIIQASDHSKIVIIGQAPGLRVQESGIPWNDPSGDNLRKWLGVDKQIFFDEELIALVPMGFCYPGTGKSGDLPPRKECAPQWHEKVLNNMSNVQLTLLIGRYAQNYYLKNQARKNLTETVKDFKHYLPNYFPLPHPSPRNNIWQKKNSWFSETTIPSLQARVKQILF